MWKRYRKNQAFTIVELLVVVVIIGILATVGLVAYSGVQASARDKSIQADLDTLDGIETQYGITNNVAGLAWYSGNGANSNINFTPSSGNIIDVVVNSTNYCIRGYNPSSASYKTLATAAIKESTPGICSTLTASTLAQAAAQAPNGGVVTTFAGSNTGRAGSTDASGTNARFYFPYGIAIDSTGNLYVADSGNNRIRKITSSGVVTTLAGSTYGYTDGTGTSAQFNSPSGIAVDSSGNAYVADSSNNRIRKITSSGVVTTLAGSTQGCCSNGYANGAGTSAQFNFPVSVAVDASGNVYVADSINNRIRAVSPSGVVTTLAGSTSGYADGTGASAQFNNPGGIAIDSSGNIYVADTYNNRIRKITSAGVVTTLAGSTSGYADGTGASAQFNNPNAVAVDSLGNLYVADSGNQKIRKITSSGVVTTIAGSTSGFTDATGTSAKFRSPIGIVVNSSGTIFVSDFGNTAIRQIQ